MDEIELSLGLSLNGRFGVDPHSKTSNTILKRSSSSSAPDFLEVSRAMHATSIGRTCSLPLEAEQETRKRREVQMLRRIEAKRKMSMKQKVSCRKSRDDDDDDDKERVDDVFHSQSSSPGTTSTGTKSPQSVLSFTEQNEYHPTFNSAVTKTTDTTRLQTSLSLNTGIKQSLVTSRPQKMVRNIANMPYVSTKANGPNGKRVEGFLYGYRRGEEVRIICVCHGSSLSPAEFIKHAGGGDVEHPLRHILVNPPPLSSISKT